MKDSHGVFLESVEGGENLGRWSIVATKPFGKQFVMEKKLLKLGVMVKVKNIKEILLIY